MQQFRNHKLTYNTCAIQSGRIADGNPDKQLRDDKISSNRV